LRGQKGEAVGEAGKAAALIEDAGSEAAMVT
jgi:hypothetical protein